MWVSLIKILEEGIAMVRAGKHPSSLPLLPCRMPDLPSVSLAHKTGDPRLRLERYLSEVVSK